MKNYSGWVIAGVICLILITLAVTGIVSFSNNAPATAPASSQAFVRVFDGVTTALKTTMHNIPFRMVA